MPKSVYLFMAVCLLSVATMAGYLGMTRTRSVAGAAQVQTLSTSLPDTPLILFKSWVPGEWFGNVAFVPLADLSTPRSIAPIKCERLHFAVHTGLCLAPQTGMFWQPPRAHLFDRSFTLREGLPLGAMPSRTRVAADGKFAAYTSFVQGDSYNAIGFSTRTSIIASTNPEELDLERFAVTKSGEPFFNVDFNFWGVTFLKDSSRFFATLGTGSTIYLVTGDTTTRTIQVLREGVECPSLSPDNTRIVFKQRTSTTEWRLAALDVVTLQDRPLTAKTRSIDDQVEWLDNRNILYTVMDYTSGGTSNIWILDIDGNDGPRILIQRASSPAVLREP